MQEVEMQHNKNGELWRWRWWTEG